MMAMAITLCVASSLPFPVPERGPYSALLIAGGKRITWTTQEHGQRVLFARSAMNGDLVQVVGYTVDKPPRTDDDDCWVENFRRIYQRRESLHFHWTASAWGPIERRYTADEWSHELAALRKSDRDLDLSLAWAETRKREARK